MILLLNGIFNLVTLIVKINKEKEQKKIQVCENNSNETIDVMAVENIIKTENEEKEENKEESKISDNTENVKENFKDKSVKNFKK